MHNLKVSNMTKQWVLGFCLWAVSVAVLPVVAEDVIPTEVTTVEVSQGVKAPAEGYQVLTGTADIQGEPAAVLKEAQASWKAACATWKAETKELNKENQVLALNCGKMA